MHVSPRRVVKGALVSAILCVFPAGAPGQPALEQARQKYNEEKYAEALEMIAAARKALPAEAKMASWRFPFPHPQSLHSALPGKERYYLVFQDSGPRAKLPWAGDNRPILNDTTMAYDFKERIVCVDTASGKFLWTRRTMGRMGLGVEPGTDDLFVWRNSKVMKLNSKNGEVIFTKDVELKKFDRLDGILANGHHLVRRPRGFDDDQREFREALLYNVATGEARRTDVIMPRRLAPDEKSVLRLSTTWLNQRYGRVIQNVSQDGKTRNWEYFHGGYSTNDPLWHQGDVIALNGDRDTKSEVVRLQGATGKVVWRFPLPKGAWRSTYWEHRRGAYPHVILDSLVPLGNRVMAIGGEGALYFLDWATGKLQVRANLGREHFLPPILVGDSLIICTTDDLRAVPLKLILGQEQDDERAWAVLAAQCLAKTGQLPQAYKALEQILREFPECRQAWKAKGELCRMDNRPWEEVEARCRLLELTGQQADPYLREKFGLAKRLPTGQNLRTDLVRFQDALFFGSEAGFIFELDTRSLEIIDHQEQPAAVLGLTPTGKLKAYLDDRTNADVAEFPGEREIKQISARHQGAAVSDPPVRWRGKNYVPLRGGHIQLLTANGPEETKTTLSGITNWRIHLGPAGPLGYGGGGVFALDEKLCPTTHLVKFVPFANQKDPPSPQWFSSDPTTFAYVMEDDEAGGHIYVRSLDGKKERPGVLYRGPVRGGRGDKSRLIPTGMGYLFFGQELVWAPAAPGAQPWRFAVGDPAPSLFRAEEAFYFQAAALAGSHLFVAASDGAIYVFNLAKLGK